MKLDTTYAPDFLSDYMEHEGDIGEIAYTIEVLGTEMDISFYDVARFFERLMAMDSPECYTVCGRESNVLVHNLNWDTDTISAGISWEEILPPTEG